MSTKTKAELKGIKNQLVRMGDENRSISHKEDPHWGGASSSGRCVRAPITCTTQQQKAALFP